MFICVCAVMYLRVVFFFALLRVLGGCRFVGLCVSVVRRHVVRCGSICKHLEAFGCIWKYLGALGSIIREHLPALASMWEDFGNILYHLGACLKQLGSIFGSICKHLEAFGSIRKHSGAFGSICIYVP